MMTYGNSRGFECWVYSGGTAVAAAEDRDCGKDALSERLGRSDNLAYRR
jgi:hypothetical protein